MEPLKEMFNRSFFERLASAVKKHHRSFNEKGFTRDCTMDIASLSLNERMRKGAASLNKFLTGHFLNDVEILKNSIAEMPGGYTNLIFPDYVAQFGKDHFYGSMEALKYFTTFGSSEFAVREFIRARPGESLNIMKEWAKDPDHHVRRLASEGSRPRLPWSFKLESVIKDPSLTAPILETLKSDPELYVRRSVANHLNDHSKDNPGFLGKLIRSWDLRDQQTAWIVKHGCRTLIKKGDAGSLAVFRFEKNPKLRLQKFRIAQKKLKLGEPLDFSFDLVSEKSSDQKLVVDYLIHYRKSSGQLSPKVFKLKEVILPPKRTITLGKKQMLKDFTTRKHFAGEHLLELQVNGKILHKTHFHLEIPKNKPK
jgi:3-methyladenine DNA glycosylase AlkC